MEATFCSNFASPAGGAVCIVHYQSGGFDCIAKRLNFMLCKIWAQHWEQCCNGDNQTSDFANDALIANIRSELRNLYIPQ